MTSTQTCRIHLIRHGTTALNVENRYRGRLDVDLDAQGWEDARRAAAQLAGTGLTFVYTSPLQRARDTAETVARAAGIAEVTDSAGLTNLDYGRWNALTAQEAADQDPAAYARYRMFDAVAACPGGESLDAAADRMVAALCEIGQLHPGLQVAAVSHAAMVRLALVRATGRTRADWRRPLPNGSITVFEVRNGVLRAPKVAAARSAEAAGVDAA